MPATYSWRRSRFWFCGCGGSQGNTVVATVEAGAFVAEPTHISPLMVTPKRATQAVRARWQKWRGSTTRTELSWARTSARSASRGTWVTPDLDANDALRISGPSSRHRRAPLVRSLNSLKGAPGVARDSWCLALTDRETLTHGT